MNESRRDHWREMIDPPGGGLTRLVRAVEAARESRPRWRPTFAFVGASAMIVFGMALCFALQAHRNSPEYRFRHAMEVALRPAAPADDIHVENGAALEVPSADPNVRIYWIAWLPTAAPRPRQD